MTDYLDKPVRVSRRWC